MEHFITSWVKLLRCFAGSCRVAFQLLSPEGCTAKPGRSVLIQSYFPLQFVSLLCPFHKKDRGWHLGTQSRCKSLFVSFHPRVPSEVLSFLFYTGNSWESVTCPKLHSSKEGEQWHQDPFLPLGPIPPLIKQPSDLTSAIWCCPTTESGSKSPGPLRGTSESI